MRDEKGNWGGEGEGLTETGDIRKPTEAQKETKLVRTEGRLLARAFCFETFPRNDRQ